MEITDPVICSSSALPTTGSQASRLVHLVDDAGRHVAKLAIPLKDLDAYLLLAATRRPAIFIEGFADQPFRRHLLMRTLRRRR
jgi:hypothetical protein